MEVGAVPEPKLNPFSPSAAVELGTPNENDLASAGGKPNENDEPLDWPKLKVLPGAFLSFSWPGFGASHATQAVLSASHLV